MAKIYKEANKSETETTIGSVWEIPLNDVSKINKVILKAKIYEE